MVESMEQRVELALVVAGDVEKSAAMTLSEVEERGMVLVA